MWTWLIIHKSEGIKSHCRMAVWPSGNAGERSEGRRICEAAGGLIEGITVWKTLWVGKNFEIHLRLHQEPVKPMGVMCSEGETLKMI